MSETEWNRYEWTFSMANANVRTNYQVLLFYGLASYDATKWVEVRKGTLKLESGSKATPYTPHPTTATRSAYVAEQARPLAGHSVGSG